MTTVDSTSDARTVNNTMRHAYRVLSDAEKAKSAHKILGWLWPPPPIP
jgi:hypothetical protein